MVTSGAVKHATHLSASDSLQPWRYIKYLLTYLLSVNSLWPTNQQPVFTGRIPSCRPPNSVGARAQLTMLGLHPVIHVHGSLLIYRPLRDGWLSWPCWLTDSGRLNHKVVTHPASSLAPCRGYRMIACVCVCSGLLDQLNTMNMRLEDIMKSLDMYLETKRQIFPRFYFISNDDLLEILGQSRNPTEIQVHLKKCFDNIKSLNMSRASCQSYSHWSSIHHSHACLSQQSLVGYDWNRT